MPLRDRFNALPPQMGTPRGGWALPGPLGTQPGGPSWPAVNQPTVILAGLFTPTDVLAGYSPPEVAAWYRRLADLCELRGGVLAPLTLRLWLDNRDPAAKKKIAAHPNLVNSGPVADTLKFHRSVYLTENKASLAGGKEKWAGIVPRLQGSLGFTKWDGKGTLDMNYQSLASYSLMQTAQFGIESMSVAEADVFTSFHNFQLRTDVTVTADVTKPAKTKINFQRFEAKALDRYDWDPNKHLTMPNPDFGNKSPWAIRPDLSKITVFHSNAKRIEAANLAAPYDLETDTWTVGDPQITGPGEVDTTRHL